MPRTRTQSVLVVAFFSILQLTAVHAQEEYSGNCLNTDSKQSPINIIPPFTFTTFNGEFQFNTLFEGFLENNNNTLRLEGDFGSIIYGPKTFNTYEINFKSPSEHTIGEDNVTLPLEIQISSISEDNSRVNIAILFSLDPEDSSFLYTLGFGKGLLQHLKPSQFLEFKGSFSLKEIVPTEKFFMYQGTTTSSPCDSSVWLIAYNTFRISQRQIDDFPRSLVFKRRAVQSLKHREVFITFYPGLEQKATEQVGNTSNNTNSTSNETKKSVKVVRTVNENERLSDGEGEIPSKIQNKDSFKIIGDTTDYDFDFYGGETAIKNRGIKFIRNEDYLVVYDKEYVNDNGESTTTINIDDKVVDQIIDSLENKKNKANCKKKANNNTEQNASNSSEDASTIQMNPNISERLKRTQSSETMKTEESEGNQTEGSKTLGNNTDTSGNKTDNLAGFFEKDLFDLWTVEKISKNLRIPTDDVQEFEEFTFKKPEQNKIFVNRNKPVSFLSFLQFDVKPEPEVQNSSPFFVITEDMIKNSQNNPIIIDANMLQNLIASSKASNEANKASKDAFKGNSNKVSKENSTENAFKSEKKVNEINNQGAVAEETKARPTDKDVTSFVQTKLVGIIKERLTEDDWDSSKLERQFEKEGSKTANQKVSFDGYVPIDIDEIPEDDVSSVDEKSLQNIVKSSLAESGIGLDKDSLENKTPEEIEALKRKMQKMLDILNNKIETDQKSIADDSLKSEKSEKSIEKTADSSTKGLEKKESAIYRLKEAAKLSKEESYSRESSQNSPKPENNQVSSSVQGESVTDEIIRRLKEAALKSKSQESLSSQSDLSLDSDSKPKQETIDQESEKESAFKREEFESKVSSFESDESKSSYPENTEENNDLSSILDAPNETEDPLFKLKAMADKTPKTTEFPGQGKLAVDKSGKWDGIATYNVSSWPERCKFGSYQSPIHIGLTQTFFVEPHMVTVDYGKPDDGKIEITNDGLKLMIKGRFGSLKYGDHELPVKELYIHHPSEHTFGEDQSRTDFEIQILHEDQAGARVMVAVFLHNMGEEESNVFLEDLGFDRENEDKWQQFREKGKCLKNEKIDLSKLLGAIPHYITYDGSLTTPPCTEGVKWIILRKRQKVTQKQVKAFQYLFGKGDNVRGTQELGSRKLKIF